MISRRMYPMHGEKFVSICNFCFRAFEWRKVFVEGS